MREYSPATEGYAAFRGHKTRFRVVGKTRSRHALICIHGGPGYGLDYLEPLEDMQATGRQVVFYDQLGCGRSDRLRPGAEWSLELFVAELEAVIAAAGLSECHVLGHGWGGMIALEYVLRHPAGVASLVLSGTPVSVPRWRAELAGLADRLPEEIRAPLERQRRSETPDAPPSRGLVDAFLRRHLCLLNPWPEALERSVAQARREPGARVALLGASELEPGGLLADWDLVPRLGEIDLPTLVTSGRADLVPPALAAVLYREIPHSEWVVFEHSAHMPHLEEPQHYLEVLDGFLARVEARAQLAPA